MNRRSFLKTTSAAGLACGIPSAAAFAHATEEPALPPGTPQKKVIPPDSPERILLKDYRPKSLYKIPVTEVAKAKFPIIDMHSHPYAKTPEANRRMGAKHGRGRHRENDHPDHGDRRGVRRHLPQVLEISRPLRAMVRLRFHRLRQARLRPRRRPRTRALQASRRSRSRRNPRQRQRPAIRKIERPRHASRRPAHGRPL